MIDAPKSSDSVAQAPPAASVVEFRLEWRNAGRAVPASELMAGHHNPRPCRRRLDVRLFSRDTPTPINTHPHGLALGPDGRTLWFSQEAGKRVARIDMVGRITEYAVPMTQDNAILGSLAFDKAVVSAAPADLSEAAFSYFRVPSRGSVMHRIVQGSEGRIWFTELALDQLGRLTLARPQAASLRA